MFDTNERWKRVNLNEPLKILCVCSHNRTRSVLMAALFEHHAGAAGLDVSVSSAGSYSDGSPPTVDAVRMLANHGLDVRGHLSRRIDEQLVRSSDLIVTAEKDHVVAIAGRWPIAFRWTYTLPEIVNRLATIKPRGERSTADWLADVGDGRPVSEDYLDSLDVGEIADPTGEPQRAWDRAYTQIDELTRRLALALQ